MSYQKSIFVILVVFSGLNFRATARASSCLGLVAGSQKVIYQTPLERHEVMDVVADDIANPADGVDSKEFIEFRTWVQTFSSTKATEILEKHLDEIKKWPLEGDYKIWSPHAISRIQSIITGDNGRLTQANCLTRELFEKHELLYPQRNYPGEMMAYVLKSKAKPNVYRIYFSDGDGKTFDSSPPFNEALWNRLFGDLSTGWTLQVHLHSHPFMIAYDKMPNIGGLLYPSDEDLQAYTYFTQSFDLKEMWITNGFEMVKFKTSDLPELIKTIPSHPAYEGLSGAKSRP